MWGGAAGASPGRGRPSVISGPATLVRKALQAAIALDEPNTLMVVDLFSSRNAPRNPRGMDTKVPVLLTDSRNSHDSLGAFLGQKARWYEEKLAFPDARRDERLLPAEEVAASPENFDAASSEAAEARDL